MTFPVNFSVHPVVILLPVPDSMMTRMATLRAAVLLVPRLILTLLEVLNQRRCLSPSLYPRGTLRSCTKKLKIKRKVLDPATKTPAPLKRLSLSTSRPVGKPVPSSITPGKVTEFAPGKASRRQLVIEEKAHPLYRREGDDLHVTMNLTLEEALCGFSKTVTTLDSRELKVSNTAVTVPNQQLKFASGGMPNQRFPLTKGL